MQSYFLEILKNSNYDINLNGLDISKIMSESEYAKLKIPDFHDDIIEETIDRKTLNLILKLESFDYKRNIEELHEENTFAKARMKVFKIKDMHALSTEEKLEEKTEYLEDITELYINTCFFPCEETLNFFKALNFDENNLNWFVDLNDIIKEIDIIIQNGKIIFLQGAALNCIHMYLQFRITNEILFWAGDSIDKYDGKKYANTEYIKRKRKNKERKPIFEENELSEEILKIMAFSENVFGEEQNNKNMLTAIDGDATKFLFGLFIDLCRKFTNVQNKNDFFREFVPLLNLLITKSNYYTKGYKLVNEGDLETKETKRKSRSKTNPQPEYEKKVKGKGRIAKRIIEIFDRDKTYLGKLEAELSGKNKKNT